ncbi:MAG: ribose-5-phosphate isomerase RpiA [Candidatus Altiarchaeota archaeon]
MASSEDSKRSAALRAAEDIEDGWTVGLGTGSTANLFLEELAARINTEGIQVTGVPTSVATESYAKKLGIPIVSLNDASRVNITVDGADEVDRKLCLIKGGGGALTREKIVASASESYIVIVDEGKVVDKLGTFPVPLEVLAFAENMVFMELRDIEGQPVVRKDFTTDNGNMIIDCKLVVDDPLDMEGLLNNIPGVLENGIFAMTTPSVVYVGKGKKVEELR